MAPKRGRGAAARKLKVPMRHELLLSALLGLWSIQCSSSDDPKGPRFPDASSFCSGWAQAECPQTVISTCLATSQEVCVANRQAACTTNVIAPALADQLAYDSSRAEGCIAAVGSAYSDAKITSAEQKSMTTACEFVFSGTRTRGATCSKDADCKQSEQLRCVVHYASVTDAANIQGTCQLPAQVAAGASCSAAEQQCANDYYCDSGSHCVQRGQIGNECGPQTPCASDGKCSEDKCVAKLDDGMSCTSNEECTSGYCIELVNLCATTYQLSQGEEFCQPMHQ
jgi:hypothetical protein